MNKRIIKRCVEVSYKEWEVNPNRSLPGTVRFTNAMHWSFVIQKNEIVEWTNNIRKGEPVLRYGFKDGRHRIHSEPSAIKKAFGLIDKRKGFELFNVRIGFDGKLRNSKPCNVCHNLIKAFGCTQCFYTDGDGVSKIYL